MPELKRQYNKLCCCRTTTTTGSVFYVKTNEDRLVGKRTLTGDILPRNQLVELTIKHPETSTKSDDHHLPSSE